jgi:acyl-CoA synthetase (AMP-forming)/AMP-acid ligase II
MSNISTLLAQSAQQNPQGIAIIAPGKPPAGGPSSPATPPETSTQNWQQIRFGELDTYVSRIAGGMARMGIRPGDRALVMVKAGIDLIAIAYALFRLGAVPILIDPGMGIKNFLSCVARSQPTAFIGIPLAHAIRVFFPGSFRSVKHPITVGPRLFWGGESLQSILKGADALHPPESSPDALAAILFTSGSTGPAKGVMYTHGMFAAQVAALKRVFDYRPGEVDLAAFPLFSLFDGALGMTTVIPDLDPGKPGKCNPALVADAARAWRATSVTGSPAIWRRVFPWCKQQKCVDYTIPARLNLAILPTAIPAQSIAIIAVFTAIQGPIPTGGLSRQGEQDQQHLRLQK